MKKIFILMCGLFFLSNFIYADAISVYVNDKALNMDVQPVIIDGRVMVPVADIARALNANVNWDNPTKTIMINKNDRIISLQLDNKSAQINGQIVYLAVPAKSMNGRTFVPVNFVAQAFSEQVEWDSVTQSVLINSDINSIN